MKLIKEELKSDSQSWLWFKAFEKSLIINLLKAQECFMAWRNTIRSVEFWNISWLWTAFLMKICTLRITFAVGQGAKKKLLFWVSCRVPKQYLAKGFPGCYRDGILLCALTESLVPGACPRFDLLDPDQPLRNLKLALHLVERHMKIKPDISAEDILHGGKFTEKRLLLLTARMKLASEKFNLTVANRRTSKDYMSQTTFVSEKCFARGMGLLLAVRGRTACFTVLLDSTDNLDMVIEIRGPKNTVCNKRITNGLSLSRSESMEFRDIGDVQIRENILNKRIPLTYRIRGRKISVSYTPLESGTHNMSIIWQGQHILGSPYTITVDCSIDTPDLWHVPTPMKRSYSRLKRSDSLCFDESIEYTNTEASYLEPENSVKKKRIVRYIVRMDGNDVIIDGKEDLCKAINNLKEQQKESDTDDNEFYPKEDSYISFRDKNKKNCNKISGVLLPNENKPSKNSLDFEAEKVPYQAKEKIISNTAKESETKWESEVKSDNRKNLQKVSQRRDQERENKSVISNGTMKSTVNFESESKTVNTSKFKESDDKLGISNELSNKIAMNSKDCHIISHENEINKQNIEYKDLGMIKPYKKSEISHEKHISNKMYKEVRIVEPEKVNDKTYNPKGSDPIENFSVRSTKTRSKSKVLFADDQLTDSLLKTENLDNQCIKTSLKLNAMNDCPSQQSSSDDVSFFPVHKVEYEVLQDDDIDSPGEFNEKRRTSFTELHESNYLEEEEDNETDFPTKGKQEIFLDGIANSGTDEIQEQHGEFEDVKSADSKHSLRANFSLFECDHNIAFWSETVEETVSENMPYGSHGNHNDSELIWENKLIELEGKTTLNDDLSTESEEGKCTRKDNTFDAKNSSSSDFLDLSDSKNENNNLLSFNYNSSHNAFEEDQSDAKRRLNLQALTDSRKRSSRCDRDILPSIRESSVEGLLDSDINNSNSDKGINECSSTPCGEIKVDESPLDVRSQSVSDKIGIFESKNSQMSILNSFDKTCNSTTLPLENTAKSFKSKEPETKINYIPQADFRNPVRCEDFYQNKILPMNILSAAPYRSRNQEMKQNEESCLRTQDVVNSSKQQLSFSERPFSAAKDSHENYVLTYAAPVVVDEYQGVGETSNDPSEVTFESVKNSDISNDPDTPEVKSVQSLSVKKVIQIFQKEKEEPIDTWPTEIPHAKSQSSRKKHNFINGKNASKYDSSDSEGSVPLSSSENRSVTDIPRSSIKDRVKLFEKDENRTNFPAIQKIDSIEKHSNYKVSAKKNYWENVTL